MSLCVYQGDALWDWLSVCWSMRLHVCVVNPFGLIRVEIVETKTFENELSVYEWLCSRVSEKHKAGSIYPPDLGYVIHVGTIDKENLIFSAAQFLQIG